MDAREWTASTVDQPEAEGGTSDTRRAWTARRVRQAAAAWWLTATSGFGRILANAADPSAARAQLGLGSLSTQSGTFSGTSSGTNTGDQTITLQGQVTGSGSGPIVATVANSAVISKVLTGYVSSPGAVASTDTILQAFQKLDGNDSLRAAFTAITRANYNLLSPPNPNTLYRLTDEAAAFFLGAERLAFVSELGTAAFLDAGIMVGNVPVLVDDGFGNAVISPLLLPGELLPGESASIAFDPNVFEPNLFV